MPWIVTPAWGRHVQIVPDVGYGIRLKPKWDRIVRRNLQAADHVTAISTSITEAVRFHSPRQNLHHSQRHPSVRIRDSRDSGFLHSAFRLGAAGQNCPLGRAQPAK
jgi:hypothetical protein